MQKIVAALLVVVGIIHLLPLSGVLGAARLQSLYGLAFDEPNLLILMQHRAVLFGLLGALLLYAAWQPALVPLALVAGFVSVLSFLGLALAAGNYNGLLARVVMADGIALVCLVAATALHFWPRPA